MRLDRNVRFDGDFGKHDDSSGKPCAGRDFAAHDGGSWGSLHQ
jgi:hypothetical protein